MKYFLTVFICKTSKIIIKLLGKNATTFPGQLALKLCPDIGKYLSRQVKKEIISVMGTNGKTTTNNLLASCYEKAGYKVVCNRLGANMYQGVIASFLDNCSMFGKLSADYACLEMDEAWANVITKDVVPNKIIITNLFRDQLDRYGEIEGTMNYLKKAIKNSPNAVLVLNADDPLVVATAGEFENQKLYFGIKNAYKEYKARIKDGQHCYNCHKNLQYNFYHFGHIGDYFCECGFKRPQIDFGAENISVYPNVAFDVAGIGRLELNGRGLYNIYNILASGCSAYHSGIENEYIIKCAKEYTPQIGRMECFTINNKKVYLILAKNPAGFNQSVGTVNEDPSEKDVLIAINDNAQDGVDISWLWDVDFDDLINDKVKSFSVSGKRYLDMSLRLKYEGVDENRIILMPDIKSGIRNLLKKDTDSLYILSNYTAIFEIRKILTELLKKF